MKAKWLYLLPNLKLFYLKPLSAKPQKIVTLKQLPYYGVGAC